MLEILLNILWNILWPILLLVSIVGIIYIWWDGRCKEQDRIALRTKQEEMRRHEYNESIKETNIFLNDPSRHLEDLSSSEITELVNSVQNNLYTFFKNGDLFPLDIKETLLTNVSRDKESVRLYRRVYIRLLSICLISSGECDGSEAEHRAENLIDRYSSE